MLPWLLSPWQRLALKLKGEPEQRGDLLWFSFWKMHSDC